MAKSKLNPEDYRQYVDTSTSLIEGIIHKLNNILTGITTNASLIGMLAQREGEEISTRIVGISEKIETGVDNIDQLLTKMVEFTQSMEQTGSVCLPIPVIDRCSDILEILLHRRITFRKRLSDDSPEIAFDPGTFVHLLYSLAAYSSRQLDGKGEVTISSRCVTDPCEGNAQKGKYLELEIKLAGSFSDPAEKEAEKPLSPLKTPPGQIINFAEAKMRETGGELIISQSSESSRSIKLFFPTAGC